MSLGLHRDSLTNLYEVAGAAQEDSKENITFAGHEEYDDDDLLLIDQEEEEEEEEEFAVFRRVEDQPVLVGSGLLKDSPSKEDDDDDEEDEEEDDVATSSSYYWSGQGTAASAADPYYYDPYSPTSFTTTTGPASIAKKRRNVTQLLCCVFPSWKDTSTVPGTKSSSLHGHDEEGEDSPEPSLGDDSAKPTVPSTTNTASPTVSPESSNPDNIITTTLTTPDTLTNHDKPKLKPILKVFTTSTSVTSLQSTSSSGGGDHTTTGSVIDKTLPTPTTPATKQRRSIIPQVLQYHHHQDNDDVRRRKQQRRVRFDTMARSITIQSRHNMTPEELSLIWYSRADYESFKKTGRVIAQAMLNGGSEIWLLNSSRNNATINSNNTETIEYYNKNKWWCKFGHSRRGLEHIADIEEGRLRQKSVQNAVEAVMNEQRKQSMANLKDPIKLARISQQYTKWAKELAMVAGLSDAEAVRSKFKEEDSKEEDISTRAKMTRPSMYTNYLKQTSFTLAAGSTTGKDTAKFQPSVLDANTASSILIRLNNEYQLQKMADIQQQPKAPTSSATLASPQTTNTNKQYLPSPVIVSLPYDNAATATPATTTTTTSTAVGKVEETYVPIHDESLHNISKQAAGFGHGDKEVDRFLEKRFERSHNPQGV